MDYIFSLCSDTFALNVILNSFVDFKFIVFFTNFELKIKIKNNYIVLVATSLATTVLATTRFR